MAVTVHKFTFSDPYHNLPEKVIITMPKGAVILCAKMKVDGEAALWALVDENPIEYEGRTFIIIGTGYSIERPEGIIYIDTILDNRNGMDYTYVWHVFEVVKK